MGKFEIQVQELAKKRGISALHKHLTDHGVSSYFATELCQGRLKRFDLDLLMRLCIIFKCPIGELVVFAPEKEYELSNWPFLRGMMKEAGPLDLRTKLDGLDNDKLKLLEGFLGRM